MRCATLLTGGTLAAKQFGETVLDSLKGCNGYIKMKSHLNSPLPSRTKRCVVADLGGRIELLLDCAELESCNGDFAVFEKTPRDH